MENSGASMSVLDFGSGVDVIYVEHGDIPEIGVWPRISFQHSLVSKYCQWTFESFFYHTGWILLAMLIIWRFLAKKITQNKAHFECPFGACNEEIRIYEPWECPKCRDDKETLPGLWGTFWDQCKKKHKSTSYQCPSCKNVFELIPGGRTDKFAKLPERLQPARGITASNVQPIHPVQTQYIPRDGNFFRGSL